MSMVKISCFEDAGRSRALGDKVSKAAHPYETKVLSFNNSRQKIADFLCRELGKKVNLNSLDGGLVLEIRSVKPCKQAGSNYVFKRAVVSVDSGNLYELKIFTEVLFEALKKVE